MFDEPILMAKQQKKNISNRNFKSGKMSFKGVYFFVCKSMLPSVFGLERNETSTARCICLEDYSNCALKPLKLNQC